jgi:hypothetical protein
VLITTESPALKRSFAAVPASMTTCCGPLGQAPVFSFSGLKRALAASMLEPTLSRAAYSPSRP